MPDQKEHNMSYSKYKVEQIFHKQNFINKLRKKTQWL